MTDDPSNPWADERVFQLEPGTITAFGIRLVSRRAQAQEMLELIEFAMACADAGVNHFVTEAFYDSRQSCCRFLLSAALQGAGASAARAVFDAARQTISQFLWEEGIHHGRSDRADPARQERR
jgi:hypothetical protein